MIGVLSCGIFTIIDFVVINSLTREHLNAALEGVNNLSKLSSLSTQKRTRELGEIILQLWAERDAARAGVYLKNKGDDYWRDYAALRKDEEFRKIIAHPLIIGAKEAGYTDCMDRNCLAVVHPLPEVENHNYREWKKQYPDMWTLVEESTRMESNSGYYRFVNAKGEAEDKYMVICRIPDTELFLTSSVFIDSFYTPVKKQIDDAAGKMTEAINRRILSASLDSSRSVKLWSLPFIVGAALLCGLFGIWFSGSITRPLHRLITAVAKLGKGNFNVRIPEEGAYETVQLAQTFNQLGTQLAAYTLSLQQSATAREAVESEIKIARSIQESLLPKKFPVAEWFELGATLQPAREVAGDFYDSFERNGKLFMIIGDVSGKGVPAAFFMGVVRTMLRDIVHNETEPGKILTIANRNLSQENETCMFVTLFLAIYDLQTGMIEYANGGHNELLCIAADRRLSTFGFTGDMALGVIPDSAFKTRSHQVEVGETLVFYTDGVTEAVSPAQILYGIERLQQVTCEQLDLAPQALSEKIAADTMAYEEGARFDDITVMIFRRRS